MPHGARRRLRRRWSAAVASILVLTSSVSSTTPAAGDRIVVLQMNLCNSGRVASCYSAGRAVDEAVDRIRRHAPELVTLQEVCRDDLHAERGPGKLARAMADLYGDGHVSVTFVPAVNRDTDDWQRCTNGEMYGVATIHHGDGRDSRHGWYASQDATEEVRAWSCSTVIRGTLTGCTTHLSTRRDVAVRQCRELLGILASPWVMPKVIVAGDFNLTAEADKPYSTRDCAAPGYDSRSDRALQHVFFTRNIGWVRGNHSDMRWTDHPALYQSFRL